MDGHWLGQRPLFYYAYETLFVNLSKSEPKFANDSSFSLLFPTLSSSPRYPTLPLNLYERIVEINTKKHRARDVNGQPPLTRRCEKQLTPLLQQSTRTTSVRTGIKAV